MMMMPNISFHLLASLHFSLVNMFGSLILPIFKKETCNGCSSHRELSSVPISSKVSSSILVCHLALILGSHFREQQSEFRSDRVCIEEILPFFSYTHLPPVVVVVYSKDVRLSRPKNAAHRHSCEGYGIGVREAAATTVLA